MTGSIIFSVDGNWAILNVRKRKKQIITSKLALVLPMKKKRPAYFFPGWTAILGDVMVNE